MQKRAERIAEFLKTQDFVKVVTHIDADGITSGAIASIALERAGIEHEVEFAKQLDNKKVEELKAYEGTIWFTDLGSGKIQEFPGRDNIIVTDHHIPGMTAEEETMGGAGRRKESSVLTGKKHRQGRGRKGKARKGITLTGGKNLFDFFVEAEREQYHLNPHLFGHNGATEISGAGVTYLVAKALSERNTDLSALAVVGAVGDLQDNANCGLVGLNRLLIRDGTERGVIEIDRDLRYFGRETRPLHRLLQYSSDPIIPSITGNEAGALEFLIELGIDLKEGDNFRRWIDLRREEKQRIVSAMVRLSLLMGLEPADVRRMVGEVYMLPLEEPGTPLHDAKEFATMLNACGKNGKPEVGFEVCRGDRGEFLARAYTLLEGHRRALAGYIQMVIEKGVERRKMLQYFNAGDEIPENIVGIVAGMLLSSGEVDNSKVMVGLASAENGLKVSARTTRALVKQGINLAEGMKRASQAVGGEGGGHNIAAGAFIPADKFEEFINSLEEILKKQRGGKNPADSGA